MFEMSGPATFSVNFNFTTPDEVVRLLRKYNAVYDKKLREWRANISRYKEAAIDVASFCRPRGIYVDLIP